MSDYLQADLNFIEFTSPNLNRTKGFMAETFGWTFIDYGPDYLDIQGAGMAAGIARGTSKPPLPVIETSDLEKMMDQVKAAGADITQDIFSFPGGRRFHFKEPGGTEMAVWSKQ